MSRHDKYTSQHIEEETTAGSVGFSGGGTGPADLNLPIGIDAVKGNKKKTTAPLYRKSTMKRMKEDIGIENRENPDIKAHTNFDTNSQNINDEKRMNKNMKDLKKIGI